MATEAQPCQRGRGLLSLNFSRKAKKDTWLRLRRIWSHLCAIRQGLANINCRGQDSTYFGFLGPRGLRRHPVLLPDRESSAANATNEPGRVPVTPYFWTTKFEFCIVFTCHKAFSSFRLFCIF